MDPLKTVEVVGMPGFDAHTPDSKQASSAQSSLRRYSFVLLQYLHHWVQVYQGGTPVNDVAENKYQRLGDGASYGITFPVLGRRPVMLPSRR